MNGSDTVPQLKYELLLNRGTESKNMVTDWPSVQPIEYRLSVGPSVSYVNPTLGHNAYVMFSDNIDPIISTSVIGCTIGVLR